MVYKRLKARLILPGGDFVVDAGGVIRLAYRSKDLVDRPPVEALLTAITETRTWP